MATIIAGRFDNLRTAKQAEAILIGSDFNGDDICTFTVNPPGQHAAFPIGGDEYADAGARHAATDAVKGAAMGGAIGLGAGAAITAVMPEAAAPAVAIATAAAGAYTGSLAGALHGMGDESRSNDGNRPEPRKAGVIIAARADNEPARQAARRAFQQAGAQDIEIANGIWRNGEWADFDPTVPPVLAE